MSWFPVDDAFHSHPKARRAGMEAVGLWVVSGSFCMAYLTDGFVPEWFVKEKPRGLALARKLVHAGLWRTGVNGDEKGWWFHDWKPECTKEHVEEARKQARIRKQKSRESKRDVTVSVTRDETRDSHVLSRGCLVPTQPNPTQPINSLVALEGGVTSGNTREARCPKHVNEIGPIPRCAACADIRRAQEAHAEQLAADRKAAAAQRRLMIGNCDLCDENGMTETPFGMVRCDHMEARHA